MTIARTHLPQPVQDHPYDVRFSERLRIGAVLALVFLALTVATACLSAAPSSAWARSYSCPAVTVDATVEPDGTIAVTETRTFMFDGSFTAVWWTFETFYSGSELVVDGVFVEGSAAQTGDLPEVPFQTPWREAGGPDEPAYSYDERDLTVWVFNRYISGEVDITLRYHVTAAVQVYDDVAELNWQYIGSEWAVDSNNVSCTVHLPVPAGTQVVAGENVRVWGHGPLNGVVHANEDGTLTETVPVVESGQFVEVRSTFPREWLTGVAPGAPNLHSGDRLDDVLDEEQSNAARTNAMRFGSLALFGLAALCPPASIVWALIMFFRHGREYRSRFKGEYWRDVPEKGVHPAVISRLWRWGEEKDSDFVATLMHLTNVGAVRIDPGSYQTPRGLVRDYYLTLTPEYPNLELSPIDHEAIRLLFGRVGNNANAIWFGSISEYGKKHPEGMVNGFNKWQGVVTRELNKKDWFEAKGANLRVIMRTLAVVQVMAMFFGSGFVGSWIPFLLSLVACPILLIIANFMPRRTPPANDVKERSEGLRKWLKDFSALDERPPTDVKVWGEFMVYAYILGVAKEALKSMQVKVPQIMDSAEFIGMRYWIMPTDGYRMGHPTGASLFDSAMVDTVSHARSTINAAEAISNIGDFISSGGGGGGGFSIGGGGGFGGGGGGAR